MCDHLTLRRFTAPQIEEMMSDLNRHYAREKLGHEPNVRELIQHWAENCIGYQVAHFQVDDSGDIPVAIFGNPA